MSDYKDIETVNDVIEILEGKINEFHAYLQRIKIDSKDPDYAHTVGQLNGLMFAQTLLIQIQRDQKNK